MIYNNNYYSDLSGFLISNLLPYINSEGVYYHFGCPSCKERFISKDNLYDKMIISTSRIVRFCKDKNIKLVYASSEGAGVEDEHPLQNTYNHYKLECENIVESNLDNYLILRIPRVYGNINKGVLALDYINNPLKELRYLDIKDFITQTINVLNLSNQIIHYNTNKSTLRDILLRYKLLI